MDKLHGLKDQEKATIKISALESVDSLGRKVNNVKQGCDVLHGCYTLQRFPWYMYSHLVDKSNLRVGDDV